MKPTSETLLTHIKRLQWPAIGLAVRVLGANEFPEEETIHAIQALCDLANGGSGSRLQETVDKALDFAYECGHGDGYADARNNQGNGNGLPASFGEIPVLLLVREGAVKTKGAAMRKMMDLGIDQTTIDEV